MQHVPKGPGRDPPLSVPFPLPERLISTANVMIITVANRLLPRRPDAPHAESRTGHPNRVFTVYAVNEDFAVRFGPVAELSPASAIITDRLASRLEVRMGDLLTFSLPGEAVVEVVIA